MMRRWARRRDRWGVGRRTLAIAVLVVALAGAQVAWQAARPWASAAALFVEVVLRPPVSPLALVTPEPSVEAVRWGEDGRGVLTRPGGPGPAPALIFVLGADPASPDDPRVSRLTESLARLGFAVLLPLSDELDAGVVSAVEVERLVEAFVMLEGDAAVRADRIGFAGLSVGGSLSIVAASDQRIAGRVWTVLAVGPYFDAASLVASTVARARHGPEGPEPWTPDRTTVDAVRATLLAALPEADRLAVGQGSEPASVDGRAVAALLDARTLAEAGAVLDALPAGVAHALRAVSPRYAVDDLRAPLLLLHDREDAYIPWTESEALAEAHPPASYHLIDLLEHVEPRPGNLGVLARDGWRLLRMFARVFREAG